MALEWVILGYAAAAEAVMYETRPRCKSAESCTPTELMRHQKLIVKSQRNALLIASALMFYWLLYSVTRLVTRVELLNQRVEKLKDQE
ncbi:hypothetical protein H5410_019688 [Solanum commersonii]|uniref:Endoplasmic reticulum transmembrane protein n=1 Tax=Solanum commersonii TaxID=4109 RepID=A0A9J5Z919_SOLCO|nr:hypothetical protein H5410_019688 [Solanum commersonii]